MAMALTILGLCLGPALGQQAEDKDVVVKDALDALDRTGILLNEKQTNEMGSEKAESVGAQLTSDPQVEPESAVQEPVDPEFLLEKVINIELQDKNLPAAFRIIERISGLPIQVDAEVWGYATLALQSVAVRDILKVLLDRHDLAMIEKEDGVRIMTAATFEKEYSYTFDKNFKSVVIQLKNIEADEILDDLLELKGARGRVVATGKPQILILTDTPGNLEEMQKLIAKQDVEIRKKEFPLVYAPGDEVMEKIMTVLTEGRGYARFDAGTGTVIVWDTKGKLEQVEKMIRDWDVPHEVAIETETVRVVLSEEYQSGIDWEAIVSDYRCMTDEESALSRADKDVSVGSISREDYDVLMEAMDTVGKMKLTSGPSMTTVTGNQIFLHITFSGETISLDLDKSPKAAGRALSSDEDESEDSSLPQELGFRLIPVVHLDQSLSLKVERPDLPTHRQAGQEPNAILLKLSSDTVAVIGGMFEEDKVQMTRKLPLLGDLPFLGRVFQRQRTKTQRIEHVVFVRMQVKAY